MKHKRLILVSITAIVFVMAGWGSRMMWLPVLAYWLDVGSRPTRVDAVYAVPGGEQRRPFVAAAFVNVGLADQVIIGKTTPTPNIVDGIKTPPHEVARRIYEVRGISTDRMIVLDGDAASTFGDVGLLGQYLTENPEVRVGVVTSAFHTRRVRWTIRHKFSPMRQRIVVFSAPNPDFTADTWWHTADGCNTILSEYMKLSWYFFRYGYTIRIVFFGVIGLAIWRLVQKRRSRTSPAKTRRSESDAVVAGRTVQ